MKYAAILLNVIGLLALGLVASLLLRPVSSGSSLYSFSRDEAKVVTGSDEAALGAAKTALATLERLHQGMTGDPALQSLSTAPSLIDFVPAAIPVDASALAGPTNRTAQHQLTLLLETDQGRRAMVDGRLVSAGDKLPDGTRIVALHADHVEIKDPGAGPQVLRMQLDHLRVGSVGRPMILASPNSPLPAAGTTTGGQP
jgi:hypothetical protein